MEGKLGHALLEGKLGQPVQNLLQVTLWVAVSMELATQRDSEEVVRGKR